MYSLCIFLTFPIQLGILPAAATAPLLLATLGGLPYLQAQSVNFSLVSWC